MNAMINHAAPCVVTGRIQQPISIMRLLEWAFADECASVDFEDAGTLARGYPSIGTEWLMMETARLGCRVDGGGRSDPDPDADMVASAVSVLPEGCGGRRMATQIAELSRARNIPDTSPAVATLCEPLRWRGNRYGRVAETSVVGRVADSIDGKIVSVDVKVCPVVYDVEVGLSVHLQRNYLLWWAALLELKMTFQIGKDLSRWQVTDCMPPMRPWQKLLV